MTQAGRLCYDSSILEGQEHRPRAFDPKARTNISQRNLPHWRQYGVIYFVTFRLADALPAEKLREWRQERDDWLDANPLPHTEIQHREAVQLWDRRINDWLDAGHGSCRLANPAAGEIVQGALLHFDGSRYFLGDYVVMPNHVHALVTPRDGWVLSDILHSWKSYTVHRINEACGRKGQLWQDESFDHIVRNDAGWRKFSKYIAANAERLPAGIARTGCGLLKCP